MGSEIISDSFGRGLPQDAMLKLRLQRKEKSGEECPFKESDRSKSAQAERLVLS